MDMIRWFRIFMIGFTLLIIPFSLWWSSQNSVGDPSGETQPFQAEQKEKIEEFEPQISEVAMNEILAEDLSFTTSLFVNQLSEQLKRWAEHDISDHEWQRTFSKELSEHAHFESFGVVEDERILFQEGEFPHERFLALTSNDSDASTHRNQELVYSDPYERKDRYFLLLALKTGKNENKQWIGGEVDISFVQSYVGDIADVADANGHFFIHQNDPRVQWENADGSEGITEKVVPELGWNIVVQTEGTFDTQELTHYSEGEVMVKFQDEQKAERWLNDHDEFHVRKHFGRYYILTHGQLSTLEMIRFLQRAPEVLIVEPNYIFEKQQHEVQDPEQSLPNDEFFVPYQWNLDLIRASEGWEITEGNENISIAVLDTGVDGNHQDLAEKMTDGFNAFEDNANFSDEHGHGTHVAGIAAAVTNNVTGIAGVSWNNQIMPVKVLDDDGEGSLYEITKGIIWATDQGADVINMSLGDHEHADMLHEAIQYAYERDVILIAASGNENVDIPMYPAAYEEVLAVSAIDQHQQKALFSNYGDYIDVTAPGEHIPSTFIDDQYVFMSGTSMAAPHVSGLAGLIRSLNPDLSNEQVMELVRESAEDIGENGYDVYFGHGQLDVSQALRTMAAENDFIQPQNREKQSETNESVKRTNEGESNGTGGTEKEENVKEGGRAPWEHLLKYLQEKLSA